MHKQMTLAVLVAVALLGGAPASATQRGPAPASILASVGHSEWCRAGTVRLDMRTGAYTVRAPARWRTCRRPAWPAGRRTGVLSPGDLSAVQGAVRRAVADGLEDRACGSSRQGQRIVISNGGKQILRLTDRAGTRTPPRELGCWSEAALDLHRSLGTLFDPPRPSQRR